MRINNRYLFNFAASSEAGGFKRLYAFAKWFNEHGGAWFIIHPRCAGLVGEFQNNHFFLPGQKRYQRLFKDCAYLVAIKEEIGRPDLYYSYGIPIYSKFGTIDWFHLQNILPLYSKNIPVTLYDRIRLRILSQRIRGNFANADVISAESKSSLGFIDGKFAKHLFLSVNGSDDELAYLEYDLPRNKDDIAVVIGTYRYKALNDAYHVFEMLRKSNEELKFVIIGDERAIPRNLRHKKNVVIGGVLRRSEVIEWLRRARYYISTTHTENSYNAASEGVFFAEESFISDIGPHRELLANMPLNRIAIPNVSRPMLAISRKDFSAGVNLKTWDDVVTEMIGEVSARLSDQKVNCG